MTSLDGLRVLDLSRFIAGPYCAMMLGDMGAEVVKIEPPAGGDPLRQWRLLKDGTSIWWQAQSRNKRSLALDLRQPEAQDIVRRLEGGKLTLDETTALYEEGVKLSALCRGKLDVSRSKVLMLVQDNMNLSEVSFDETDA